MLFIFLIKILVACLHFLFLFFFVDVTTKRLVDNYDPGKSWLFKFVSRNSEANKRAIKVIASKINFIAIMRYLQSFV